MNQAGIRISRLRIEAFRGIGEPLDLDFSSPITVVFAPNGTGKTTMCDAVEWLLTSQVGRLRDGQAFNPEILYSKFSKGLSEPLVRGQLQIGANQHVLTRTVSGGWLQEAPEGRPTRIGDLLAMLAPAAAAPDAHHRTAISLRQNWLRGTRFLSAEALSALVDTDDSTIERRTQVFADLLGIRHLLDAERTCERYLDVLAGTESKVSASVQNLEDEIAKIRLEIAKDSGSQNMASSLSEIESAERQLGVASSASSPFQAIGPRIEAATANHARRNRARLQRQALFDNVAGTWTRREELERQLARLRQEEAPLALQSAKIEAAGRATVARLAKDAEDRISSQGLLSELRQTGSALAQLLTRVLSSLGQHSAAISLPANATFGSLRQALPESTWTLGQIQQRRSQISAAISNFAQAQNERDRFQSLNGKLFAMQSTAQSDDSIASLRLVADQAKTNATAARSAFEAMAAPIARLQAAGREFIAHAHDETTAECPLCGHDWKLLANLQEAINTTLDGTPEIIRIAEATVAETGRAATAALSAYETAVRHRDETEELRKEANLAFEAMQSRANSYREIGVDIELTNARDLLVHFDRRLVIAHALAELYQSRDALAAAMFEEETASVFAEFVSLSGAYPQFSELVKRRVEVLESRIAEASNGENAATKERDVLRADYAAVQSTLANLREQISASATELEGLRGLWTQLAPKQEWGAGALEELRLELAQEAARLATVDAHIAAALKAWSTEAMQARLSELGRNIAALRKRHAAITKRVDAGRRAAGTFHEAYREISGRQVSALSQVVNPLFARMHANRVFDEIDMGHADNFLHWLATAGEAQMDPRTDFSQGQRQDLALALFLARARSLGGTFFLDEPVTHLDDLNRVGLLDVFRAAVVERNSALNLVVTTASRVFARHMVEKFMNVGLISTSEGLVKPLRVIELSGNARTGVTMSCVYPLPGAA